MTRFPQSLSFCSFLHGGVKRGSARRVGRAERNLLHVKMSSGATYAVRRRRTRPRAIPLALTKISRIDRLPFFLTHGALRARAERRYKENKQATEYHSVYSSLFYLRKGRIFPNSLGGLFFWLFLFVGGGGGGGGELVACPCGLVIFFRY